MPAPAPSDLLGTCIADKYVLEELVARGGMGAIYRATQRPLGREVAVKILAPSESSGHVRGIDQTRFFREASVASRLTHPNTVVIHDYGALEGRPGFYLVMEYLHGRTLAQAIVNGPMALSRVVHIAAQVCSALVEAHASDVVHRDLKPQNIMLIDRAGDADFVKVVDFGLVKMLDGDERSEEQTDEGSVLGSPLYMAPEQIFAGEIDARTDVYSLGVVLYNLLVGRPPFIKNPGTRGVATIMMGHTTLAPPKFKVANPDVDIDPRVEAVVHKCLSKKPEDRYGSVAELAEDLIDAATDITETQRARATSTLDWNSGNDVRDQVAARMAALRKSSPLGPNDETGAYQRDEVSAAPSETSRLGAAGQLNLGASGTETGSGAGETPARARSSSLAIMVAALAVAVLVAVLLWPPGKTGPDKPVAGSDPVAKTDPPSGTAATHKTNDPTQSATPPRTPNSAAEPKPGASGKLDGSAKAQAKTTEPAAATVVKAKDALVKVTITSTPGANVTDLNGKRLGETPLKLDVPVATLPFTVELRRAGFATGELRVTKAMAADTHVVNLSIALAPVSKPAPTVAPPETKPKPPTKTKTKTKSKAATIKLER